MPLQSLHAITDRMETHTWRVASGFTTLARLCAVLRRYRESKRLKGGKGGMFGGIATQSKRKIDIQAGSDDGSSKGGIFVDE